VSYTFRKKIRKVATVFCLLSLILSFPACSTRNRVDGYIHYRLNYNPTTLDPALVVDVTGGLIAAKLFNGLVRLDEDLNVIPDVSERWEIREKGTAYLFFLRKGVRFANQREVTAYDVKYSFKRILDPKGKSPNSWVLDKILGAKEYVSGKAADVEGIEVKGRYTLKIRLVKPFSPFLNLLTMTAAYIVPEEEVKKWGADYATHPVGSGPFIMREWKHNNQLVLERNEGYFNGQARIAGIVYRIIPEDLTAVTEFELGNLDVVNIPAYEYFRYKNSSKWRGLISSVKGLNTYYLGFNCSRPPFNNRELRKAVSYAIDRRKILETFYEGRGRLSEGPVPDVLRKWDLHVTHEYDPAKAKRIIEKEGAVNRVVNFYITSDQEVVDIAEIIQSFLNKAGLDVRIKQLEWSAYKSAINKGEADLFWLSWWADYPDPENFLFPLFHSSNHGAGGNRARYTNKEVDRLIEAGQGSIVPSDRDHYYSLAEGIISEESPWVFFWHKTDFTLHQPYVKNYRIYHIYSMDKGLEVSF
jgi:peptide/nickel transport system substrate-binding protein/oligopeptide transport system substrate-binding protein